MKPERAGKQSSQALFEEAHQLCMKQFEEFKEEKIQLGRVLRSQPCNRNSVRP